MVRLSGVMVATLLALLFIGCGSSGKKTSCVSSLDGTPRACDQPYAVPKENYRPVSEQPPAPPEQQGSPPKEVQLDVGPPSTLDSDGVDLIAPGPTVALAGTVKPPSALLTIERATFDSSGNGSGVAPYKTMRLTDGKVALEVPIDAPTVQYRLAARATGYKTAKVQYEFVRRGAATPPSTQPALHAFSGNGTKNLGTISVPTESLLVWTNDGGTFSVLSDDPNLAVSSEASHGNSVVPAGRYKNVEVIAVGNWTIRLRPR